MSSGLLFMLLLCGIGGNMFCDARPAICVPGTCDFPPLLCRREWTYYEGRCYLFRRSKATWASAETFCNEFGAHLTSIQGQDQYDFIRSLIVKATGTNTRTWVGGTNAVQEDLWMWADGSPFTFTSWGPGEPNNAGGNEHCMEINLNGQDYVNDENCNTRNAFVCAKKA